MKIFLGHHCPVCQISFSKSRHLFLRALDPKTHCYCSLAPFFSLSHFIFHLSRFISYLPISLSLSLADLPTLKLELGTNMNPEDIEEGDDVYFECKVNANPSAYKVVWKHNVSILLRFFFLVISSVSFPDS